jgi:hypothetical protein
MPAADFVEPAAACGSRVKRRPRKLPLRANTINMRGTYRKNLNVKTPKTDKMKCISHTALKWPEADKQSRQAARGTAPYITTIILAIILIKTSDLQRDGSLGVAKCAGEYASLFDLVSLFILWPS